MIETFLKTKDTYMTKSKFGNFIYDIDVDRTLPKRAFFDINIAKEGLLCIYEVFKKNDLRFFLIFGTCLGAVRDKKFIEDDVDIDIGIYQIDTAKLIQSIVILKEKFDFRVSKVSLKEESITIVYKNIIIDIGLFSKKDDYYIYNDFYENKMPQEFLDRLDSIEFLDKYFYVPFNVKRYLKHQYGKNWKTPIKEWDYFNKYMPNSVLFFLRKTKSNIRLFIKKTIDKKYFILLKIGLLHRGILQKLGMRNIKNAQKSGQGFCDTYVIKANQNIVLKVNNQSRFEYFKDDFKKVEPIYQFLDYKERFLYEKNIFEKLNKQDVKIINNSIIFPFIDSKPLNSYIGSEDFYIFLKEAIFLLKNSCISHGDFHIENILISRENKIILIDFEMIFSDYLSKEEQFYYDIYYLFAKLEYKYSKFFDNDYKRLKKFINDNFSPSDKDNIIKVSDKTKRYFFSVNGARVELFK